MIKKAEGRRVGYARVSTDDQNLDMQLDALRKWGCAKIYEERLSGGIRSRPRLNSALRYVRRGDTFVVWRLDRLGRSLQHLVETLNKLARRGVKLESITESIDTSSTTGTMLAGLFAVMAEYERNLIRERTLAGLAAARARGRIGGRRPKFSPEQRIAIAKQLHLDGRPPAELAAEHGCSRGLIYKIKHEYPEGSMGTWGKN